MSPPFTFIIPTLIVCALVLIFGALFGGQDEKPAADPKDAEISALEAKLREMKRRAALEGGAR
jgi:hypothetical protein